MPGAPTPVPSYASLAGKIEPWDPVDWAKAAFQYIEDLTTDMEWRRVMCIWQDVSGSNAPQDNAVTTFDIANYTGGQLDSSWTTTDYDNCESALDQFFGGYAGYCPSRLTFKGYRWYRRKFTPVPTAPIIPPDKDVPFEDAGVPARITTRNVVGLGTSPTSSQTAMTFTKRTPWAKHWGRNYLPITGGVTMSTNGRFTSACQDQVATLLHALVTALTAADFQLQVAATSFDKQPIRTLLNVTQLSIDDVPDVVRRRRLRNVARRAVKP